MAAPRFAHTYRRLPERGASLAKRADHFSTEGQVTPTTVSEGVALRSIARFSILAIALPLAVSAATPKARFPAKVTSDALEMTGLGFVTPTPHKVEAHFPASVKSDALEMTGLGFVTPTPHKVEAHFPASVKAPALEMTGTKGT